MAICLKCSRMFIPSRHSSGKYCSGACYHSVPKHKATLAARFWKFVKKTDRCWLWTGSNDGSSDGYGRIRDFTGRKIIGAHRASWQLHFGPIPPDLEVCHRCDNPPCVRPDHLFLGTNTANAVDMVKKGRHKIMDNRGEHHGMSKLTSIQVLEIRRLGETMPYGGGIGLAKQFGICQAAVSNILKRKSWAHI